MLRVLHIGAWLTLAMSSVALADTSVIRTQDQQGARLSEWIYRANAESKDYSMQFKGDNAEYHVHAVLNETVTGSPKVASVTSIINIDGKTVKTLFLVFKGTSNFHDVLHWNFIAKDYDFTAAVGDAHLFAHGGATVVARNLVSRRIFKEAFLARLGNSDAQALVVTGHSLGGMYANLILYRIKYEMKTLNDSQMAVKLLDTMRAVTFGSPMVFGYDMIGDSSSTSFREFEKFMARCSKNYVNNDDPCPRAWSALDLEQFLTTELDNYNPIHPGTRGTKGTLYTAAFDWLKFICWLFCVPVMCCYFYIQGTCDGKIVRRFVCFCICVVFLFVLIGHILDMFLMKSFNSTVLPAVLTEHSLKTAKLYRHVCQIEKFSASESSWHKFTDDSWKEFSHDMSLYSIVKSSWRKLAEDYSKEFGLFQRSRLIESSWRKLIQDLKEFGHDKGWRRKFIEDHDMSPYNIVMGSGHGPKLSDHDMSLYNIVMQRSSPDKAEL